MGVAYCYVGLAPCACRVFGCVAHYHDGFFLAFPWKVYSNKITSATIFSYSETAIWAEEVSGKQSHPNWFESMQARGVRCGNLTLKLYVKHTMMF